MHLCMANITTSQNKDWYSSVNSAQVWSAAQVFSQIKSQLFHFNKMDQLYRKCTVHVQQQSDVLYMLQIVCKTRQEDLALTNESHGPPTILVFFKGISKYLKINPHDTVYMDFQTLQTILSEGQKSLCLHLQENDFAFKAKGRSFC